MIDGVEHQKCTAGCDDWLPMTTEYFYRVTDHHKTPFPVRSECKVCAKLRERARNKAMRALAAEQPERFEELVQEYFSKV